MTRLRAFSIPMAWALGLVILGGCMSDRTSDIPANAMLASSGNGVISYTAPSDGRVWVSDVSNNRIDYSGPLLMNQSIIVDTQQNQITVAGRVSQTNSLSVGAQHRIYFMPSNNSGVPAEATPGT